MKKILDVGLILSRFVPGGASTILVKTASVASPFPQIRRIKKFLAPNIQQIPNNNSEGEQKKIAQEVDRSQNRLFKSTPSF